MKGAAKALALFLAGALCLGTAAQNSGWAERWDLTVTDKSGTQMPSWLVLGRADGAWQGWFVGRWGSARALPKVQIDGDQIVFVSPKEEEGSRNDLVFEGKLVDDRLEGSAEGPNGAKWTWRGERAPELARPAEVKWGREIILFDGTDLKGWRFDNPKKAGWRVKSGTLVNAEPGANIITTGLFGDFKLHAEVNCPKDANSGIYLRGRYEVQMEDDSLSEPANHHMGAVYGFLAPEPEQPRRPGEWQTFDITLLGRYVTVVQNGHTIIDNKEIPGITGGALDSHEELPGPIYLQGDHGPVAYRNLRITPRIEHYER